MQSATLLLRQVNPQFYKDGRVLSVAFKPTANHKGLLSVYDGDRIEADAAWAHFSKKLGLASAGTWAVTVAETTSLNLSAKPMPLENFPEHAAIDFNGHDDKAQRAKAKMLAAKAEVRGCLFAAPPPPTAA